jgi:hypothetical protein
MDPRIRIQIHTKMSWIRNTGHKFSGLNFFNCLGNFYCSNFKFAGFKLLVNLYMNEKHLSIDMPIFKDSHLFENTRFQLL